MGEKPTAAEDAAAKSSGGGKETEAQAAQAEKLAGSGAADPPVPMEASNLNSSKSNVARATNLNSSRSNIAREQGDPSGSGDVPDDPSEAANLNLSKSNID